MVKIVGNDFDPVSKGAIGAFNDHETYGKPEHIGEEKVHETGTSRNRREANPTNKPRPIPLKNKKMGKTHQGPILKQNIQKKKNVISDAVKEHSEGDKLLGDEWAVISPKTISQKQGFRALEISEKEQPGPIDPDPYWEKGSLSTQQTGETSTGVQRELRTKSLPMDSKNFNSGDYQQRVKAQIEKGMQYPHVAVERNLMGVVVVGFHIKGNGEVSHVHLVRSSQHAILDEEALETIRRVSPFPPFPKIMEAEEVKMRLSLRFGLEKS